MDSTDLDIISIFFGVLKSFWWLLPFLLIAAVLKSRRFKGWVGESLVSRKANLKLPPEQYHAYDNVTLPDGVGTTQIDHIYVSRFGVFVVETKNMAGWIFGAENQAQWTQTIYKRKSRFQNPIRQNYKHIKTLETRLQVPASKLHTVIVFTGDSTFKTELPRCVCALANFADYIKSFSVPVLSDAEVAEIRGKIESGRLEDSRATRSVHIQNLRDRHR
jgi:restriction system protein